MELSKTDKEIFKKLKLSSILDLVVLAPSSYENLTLLDTPHIGTSQVVDVTIKSLTKTFKYMKLNLYAHNFEEDIEAIIFNPKYYHTKNLQVGNRYFLYGKMEENYSNTQILQPKIITEHGKITPKYKTPLQNKTILKLMQKFITKENLKSYGLKDEVCKALLLIHNPDMDFYLTYTKEGGFFGKYLKALKYTEIFNHILKLSKLKTTHPSLKVLNSDISTFINSLPFTLTNDQLKVIEEVKADLSSKTSAKRIIMGDVGCGKTIIILAAVALSYPQRSILLVPTTILGFQIYEEAKKYLPKEMKIAFISNKSKDEDLSQYDFIIGTHALLFRDLPTSPLIMIDEQHRFGTKQREAIKQLVSSAEKQPHFLQFSATPIPRTMAMIESSYIDISTIKELPYKKDIDTKILYPKNFSFLTNHIEEEIKGKRQTIVVYPLVEESETIDYQSIEEAREYWEKKFKKVYVTYGKDKNKEEVLNSFKNDGNILIATTLIEVGISLPNLSTIVIVAPERLGLATLHQLRGRVSRNGLKGYCYLFTKKEPTSRLNEFCKTLDGFKIAELDLKLRESGDLLKGEKQSGKQFNFFSHADDEDILYEVKEDWK